MAALYRRQRVTELACEVAAVLNTVLDEDERGLLREQFDATVAEEERLGAQIRARLAEHVPARPLADALLAATVGLHRRPGSVW